MRRYIMTAAIAIAVALALVANDADAAPSRGYAPTAEAQGTRLQLNGSGTRRRAGAKLYELALYTLRKVETPEELRARDEPVKLQFVALREMSTTELGQLFVKGMSENATHEQYIRQMMLASRLAEIFSTRARVLPGESFSIEYTPGRGTQFVLMGERVGAPIAEPDFFPMVLRIWFGPAPVDRELQDALLGRANMAARP